MDAGEIGSQRRRALHHLDGLGQRSRHSQRIAERIQRLGALRTRRERRPIMPDRGVPLSLRRQSVAKRGMRLGMLRPQREDTAIMRYGRSEIAQLAKGEREIEMAVG